VYVCVFVCVRVHACLCASSYILLAGGRDFPLNHKLPEQGLFSHGIQSVM
jgi:hypothetical protein